MVPTKNAQAWRFSTTIIGSRNFIPLPTDIETGENPIAKFASKKLCYKRDTARTDWSSTQTKVCI